MNVQIAFWGTLCVNSPYDPFDPTDDIVENGVVFWANNTTGDVDLSQVHRWRLTTMISTQAQHMPACKIYIHTLRLSQMLII